MDVIEKQLEYLNSTMKETASEANSFLLKYHFGGIIAVVAMLNIDLVLFQSITFTTNMEYILFFIAILLAFLISWGYFYFVLKHYGRFSKSHRKLKYKYELTLHLLLSNGSYWEYQYYLEKSVSDDIESNEPIFNDIPTTQYEFKKMAEYLINHHREKYKELDEKDRSYLYIAMLIIVFTLSIRCIFLLIQKT